MSASTRIEQLLSGNSVEAMQPRRGRIPKRNRSIKVRLRDSLQEAAQELDKRMAGVLAVTNRRGLGDCPGGAEGVRKILALENIEVQIDDDLIRGDSPEAVLFRRLSDAMGQYTESRQTQNAHQKKTLATRKRKGLRGPGSLPFGKRLAADGETLLDDRSEAAIVKRIIRERDDGSPLRAIVEGLNADNVPARGGRWHRTTVSRVLSRQG